MKKMILTTLYLVAPLLIFSQTPISSGPVSGTWDLNGSPYNINGEIYIEDAATLVIEPGVEVNFTGWYKFIVYGSLMAEGTENANITFTSQNIGVNWWGIRFTGTDKTSILDYCIVENGKTFLTGGGTPDNSGGGILCYNSPNASITIKNSVIRDNQAWFGGGICCDSANIQIEKCEITDNTGEFGGGFYCRASNPVLTDCLIAYNYAVSDGGGFVCQEDTDIELYDNTIIHNIADWHAGGFDCAYATGFIAENNLFAHNTAEFGGAGSFYHSTGLVLRNNTWANNKGLIAGGAIYFWNSSSSHTNDIFYFNEAGSSGNFNQIHLGGTESHPDFYYCNIQDSIDGFSGAIPIYNGSIGNCIFANPLFADTLNGDFNITWQNYPGPDWTRSPCIDAGEPGFLTDPDGTRQDIGAYPYFQQLDVPIAYNAQEIGPTSFLAVWSNSFGYGYNLDVALDEAFTNFQYENIYIVGDTCYLAEGLGNFTSYYYRVRSYNYDTTLVSSYSNIIPVITTSIKESVTSEPEFYASNGIIRITIDDRSPSSTDLKIYSIDGKLLSHQGLNPGSNEIDPGVSDQVVIVSISKDGKVYNGKLLMK